LGFSAGKKKKGNLTGKKKGTTSSSIRGKEVLSAEGREFGRRSLPYQCSPHYAEKKESAKRRESFSTVGQRKDPSLHANALKPLRRKKGVLKKYEGGGSFRTS